jgi:hypothetical protein
MTVLDTFKEIARPLRPEWDLSDIQYFAKATEPRTQVRPFLPRSTIGT